MRLKGFMGALLLPLGLAAAPAAWADLQFAKDAYSVPEGTSTIELSIVRTGSINGDVSVSYATVATAPGDTATAGVDFVDTDGTATWADQDGTAKAVTVTILNDAQVEADETFRVVLTGPVGTGIGPVAEATVTILNDDSAPGNATVGFTKQGFSVGEAGTEAVLTVNRGGNLQQSVAVTYTTSGDTAVAGADFADASGSLSWGINDTSVKEIKIPIVNDAAPESDESFAVQLQATSPTTIVLVPTARVTILDDDASAGVSTIAVAKSSYSVREDGGDATISIVRSGNVTEAASVVVATEQGTAQAALDFVDTTGSLSWAAGEGGAKPFTFSIIDDDAVDAGEQLTVRLSSPTGATLGAPASATVSIVDDESTSPGDLRFELPAASITEADTTLTVAVIRVGGANGAVSVNYQTLDGDATVGDGDYAAAVGTLSWADGDAAPKSFTVSIRGDAQQEGDEQFSIQLSNPTGGAALAEPANLPVTIVDDEQPNPGEVSLLMSAVTVSERAGAAELTVQRSGGSLGAISVGYQTVPGSAEATLDYTSTSGTVAWATGEADPKTITVPLVDDASPEGSETLTVKLLGATGGATIAPAGDTAVITILDDDSNRGVLQFRASSYTAKVKNGSVSLVVERTDGATGEASVGVQTIDGTASADTDFSGGRSDLTWNDGDAAPRTVLIALNNEALSDTNKQFTVALVDNQGAGLGTPAIATVHLQYDRVPENTGVGAGPVAPVSIVVMLVMVALRRRIRG